ncbi:MAG: HDIG domain-containing metalloprotein [Promethearchaeota archaeon]
MGYNKNIKIPSKKEVKKIFTELELPQNIQRHSMAVSKKGAKIAAKIKNINVNINLVKIGGMLHDIGRSKSHGFDHAVSGGKIIRKYRFSEQLARIAETHILGGLTAKEAEKLDLQPKNYLPETIEEKIVCLADKYYIGTKKVTIEERWGRWFARYGKTDLLKESKKRIERIEIEIYKLMYP